jgi:endoglucanase
MNEPHDVPNINTWAASVQAAVTAIRQAGYVVTIRLFPKKNGYLILLLFSTSATSQMILLPGNDWTSAGSFVSDGSAAGGFESYSCNDHYHIYLFSPQHSQKPRW